MSIIHSAATDNVVGDVTNRVQLQRINNEGGD